MATFTSVTVLHAADNLLARLKVGCSAVHLGNSSFTLAAGLTSTDQPRPTRSTSSNLYTGHS